MSQAEYVSAYYQPPCDLPAMRLTAKADKLVGVSWQLDCPKPTTAQSPVLEQSIHELDGYFSGTRHHFGVALKMEVGTVFEQKVWQMLQHIEYGQTLSYKQLACRIGHPNAYRAVANAAGKNPFMVMVGCHRLVATQGLGGYCGGVWVKRLLLDFELKNT